MIKDLLRYNKAKVGLILLITLTAAALSAPLLAPCDPYGQHIDRRLEGPSADFLFGTDHLGRCVFSRIIFGARLSLKIAVIIVGIQVLAGLALLAVVAIRALCIKANTFSSVYPKLNACSA